MEIKRFSVRKFDEVVAAATSTRPRTVVLLSGDITHFPQFDTSHSMYPRSFWQSLPGPKDKCFPLSVAAWVEVREMESSLLRYLRCSDSFRVWWASGEGLSESHLIRRSADPNIFHHYLGRTTIKAGHEWIKFMTFNLSGPQLLDASRQAAIRAIGEFREQELRSTGKIHYSLVVSADLPTSQASNTVVLTH